MATTTPCCCCCDQGHRGRATPQRRGQRGREPAKGERGETEPHSFLHARGRHVESAPAARQPPPRQRQNGGRKEKDLPRQQHALRTRRTCVVPPPLSSPLARSCLSCRKLNPGRAQGLKLCPRTSISLLLVVLVAAPPVINFPTLRPALCLGAPCTMLRATAARPLERCGPSGGMEVTASWRPCEIERRRVTESARRSDRARSALAVP